MKDNPEIEYVGINVADTSDDAQAFVERYDWTWPQMQDPERARAKQLGAAYQPYFILVDAQGGIVDRWEGGGDAEIWEAMVAKLP